MEFPKSYLVRREAHLLNGDRFRVLDKKMKLLYFCQEDFVDFKEDLRFYPDQKKTKELLVVKSRNVIDFSAAYDVTDPETGTACGMWRRQGVKSILRDSWELCQNEEPIATLKEDSAALASFRRFVSIGKWLPQKYFLKSNSGEMLATLTQHFNPFVYKMDITNHKPEDENMAKLLAAGAVLLEAIEGRL